MEHPYFIAAYLTAFSPPCGETKLKISLSGNSCSGKTPRPAPQGAKPGVSSQVAGFAGTQALPESQLDRFMVSLSIGYPSIEDQMKIISAQRYANPLDELHPVTTAQNVIEVQKFLSSVKVMDDMLRYAIELCEKTRIHPLIELGISPRGIAALVRMARASAVLHERNYVVPEDIQSVFLDVCAHRLVLRPQARVDGMNARDVLRRILSEIRQFCPRGKRICGKTAQVMRLRSRRSPHSSGCSADRFSSVRSFWRQDCRSCSSRC